MDNQRIDASISFLKKIFPNADNLDYEKLMMTKEAVYSVSMLSGSNKLVEGIKDIYKDKKNYDELIVTDGTANVGSDSINLALNFGKVHAIEYDPVNYDALKNNSEIYRLDNINLFNDNSLSTIPSLKQHILYFDPPWRERNQWKKLYLIDENKDHIYADRIYNMFKNSCELFILKYPPEFNIKSFIKRTKIKDYHIIDIPRIPPKKHRSPYFFHYIFIKTPHFLSQNGGAHHNDFSLIYKQNKNKYIDLSNDKFIFESF